MVKDIRWLFQDEDEEKEDRGKEDTGEAVYLWDDKEGTVGNGRSYGPVSYTHLDVYKRQYWFRAVADRHRHSTDSFNVFGF